MSAGLRQRGAWMALALACAGSVASAPGQTYMVAMFHEPITRTMGLSATELSAAYLVATASASLLLVPVGRLSDRLGPRRTLGLVALGFGFACGLMGLVAGAPVAWGLPLVTLGFFFLRWLGQGSMTLTSGHLLARFFDTTLGRMESVRSLSVSAAVATAPAFAVWLIEGWGWSVAYPVLGAMVWILVLPLAVAARDEPRPAEAPTLDRGPVGAGSTVREAMRQKRYWVIASAAIANALMVTALLFHMQPMLATEGVDPSRAPSYVTIMAVVAFVLMLFAGWLADRIRPELLFSAGLVSLAVASMSWQLGLGELGVVLSFGALGAAQPLIAVPMGPAIARSFGPAHHAAIRGSMATAAVLGTSVGPLALGASFDTTGSFAAGRYGMALAAFVLALLTIAALRGAAQHSASPSTVS